MGNLNINWKRVVKKVIEGLILCVMFMILVAHYSERNVVSAADLESRVRKLEVRAHVLWLSTIPHREMVITSGVRNADKQAVLLWEKYRNGVNLKRLYKNKTLINEAIRLIDLGRFDELVVYIEDQARKGNYISKHMCGQAIDISIRNLTKSEIKKFLKFSKIDRSIQVLYEGDHLHVQTFRGCE